MPYNLRLSGETEERWRACLNDPGADLVEYFGCDVRYVGIPLPPCPEGLAKNQWVPRAAPEDISKCRQSAERLKESGFAVCGSYSCGVFEQAKDWFGDEATLTMPFDEPERLEAELDRITQWKMDVYGAYVKAGVDIVWIGDDLGMQRNLIMSPRQYRQWYRPCHARIVEHLRALRPDVRIAFHCCGYVTGLIPDLIEIGINVLEAVQPECMDLSRLKREFGRDLSFWGAVGIQYVLARSSRREVVDGVRRTLDIMAPGGGYIAAPCHTLTEEVPWENALAFHEALKSYGAYPF